MAKAASTSTPPSIGSPGPGGTPGGGGPVGPANAVAQGIRAAKKLKILFGTIFIGCKNK